MKYIAVEEFCNLHGVEVKLIREFADFGLVSLHIEDNREFLPLKAITRLERTLRLFRELEVNKEGIEVILHMRQQLKKLRRQQVQLNSRLQQMEQPGSISPPGQRNFIVQEIDPELE
jgi:DNA-binding transcriptional MerR regulator